MPNNSARNLKLNDARNIAVLVKGITNPFFTSMIKVFEKECSDHDYALVLEHVEEEQDETELAALLEKEKRLNGIIFRSCSARWPFRIERPSQSTPMWRSMTGRKLKR